MKRENGRYKKDPNRGSWDEKSSIWNWKGQYIGCDLKQIIQVRRKDQWTQNKRI